MDLKAAQMRLQGGGDCVVGVQHMTSASNKINDEDAAMKSAMGPLLVHLKYPYEQKKAKMTPAYQRNMDLKTALKTENRGSRKRGGVKMAT
jgi:hypothetical protein